ncbi:sigma-70 family RNA polymerase sigma factor [Pseudomonas huaxiensis]|uniref:sigma-70 family RNA polymerase sigma factor n=1 Tax=Pseudomonas huaxiensis TaxID=2213017 RepID=UPI000DA6544B|nr:sigma-70 family RNA polymerase sigma factor [Pseudomonas huaxiensis]
MSVPTSPHQNIGDLYRDHRGWLVEWLRQRLGNSADAADLTHDTFIRLLGAKPLAIDSPRAYLATVANRLLISLYRRRSLEKSWLETLAHLPEQSVLSLESQALVLEALHEVDQVLSCLPARTRQAFLMAQLEGYTQEEIAHHMGIHVRSVQRHLARAYEECIMLATTQS